MDLERLRYPMGRWQRQEGATAAERRSWIDAIAAAPLALRVAVTGLGDEQLDTPYRPGGWTARQLVHHVPDSHLNAYVRTCLALTEDRPTIRPYDEAAWAELGPARTAPVEPSLAFLEALHERWVALLRSLGDDAFERPLSHPEIGMLTLTDLLSLYVWHGRHHAAHVTELRKRRGW
ncbi:MAG TPA: bacillithiol transferase BstA [Thermoanaerobaculia bacterium]|nr:bacillithiol transferase BstA [Thermoanaerobaculia bacterium]